MHSRAFRGLGIPIWVFALAACGTPGARPHDMSAQHHEEAAAGHEAEATQHAAMFDPNAHVDRADCVSAPVHTPTYEACRSSTANPTEEHLREAARHRRMAADHRAASQVLRNVESQACVGLRETDRDVSPFAHREDIASVGPLIERVQFGRTTMERRAGVIVTLRAQPGMTAEWLQRVVNCHIAHNAALGHDVPEMDYCPLVPNEVSAQVWSTGDGFAVAVRSDNEASIREIQRRAALLTARPTQSAGL